MGSSGEAWGKDGWGAMKKKINELDWIGLELEFNRTSEDSKNTNEAMA